MTLAPSHCPTCDAKVTAENTKFCTYCGTQLPKSQVAVPDTQAERFAALEAHADFASLLAIEPSIDAEVRTHNTMIGFLILFVVLGLPVLGVFFVVSLAFGSLMPLILIIPLAVVGFGIYMLVRTIKSASAFKRAEMRSWPGAIIDERTKVSGGGKNSSASTTYFVTLEDSAGRRREFRARGPVAGKVSAGDMGVAYSKAEFLIDFTRVEV